MNKLLAPNGKPSKLTPEQYKLVRSSNFKKWFGDWENDSANSSKVIDEETKEPLVVYHYTDAKNIREFYPFAQELLNSDKNKKEVEDIIKKWKNSKSISLMDFRAGTFFTPKRGAYSSYGENEYACFLKGYFIIKTGDFVKGEKQIGYPSMKSPIWYYFNDINPEIVALYPEQIKLADGTNTTFDGNNPDIRFDNGGETNLDNIELDFYVVIFDTDDNSEIKLVTTDFEDAKYRYDSTSIGDYGDGSFGVSLQKFTNKYKFVYELDEDETIEDYPIKDYHKDSYYYELIEEGEHEVIENRFIESVNNSSNDLLNDLENWAKNKFGNYKYNRIDVYSEDDENEENDSIGSIQLRIADHSQNENNLPYGIDRSLSVVIANKDATRGRFQQNKPQIYFNGDDSFDYVTDEIENYIETLKDDIRSDYKLGGEVKTGLFSQIWEWFGIKF